MVFFTYFYSKWDHTLFAITFIFICQHIFIYVCMPVSTSVFYARNYNSFNQSSVMCIIIFPDQCKNIISLCNCASNF